VWLWVYLHRFCPLSSTWRSSQISMSKPGMWIMMRSDIHVKARYVDHDAVRYPCQSQVCWSWCGQISMSKPGMWIMMRSDIHVKAKYEDQDAVRYPCQSQVCGSWCGQISISKPGMFILVQSSDLVLDLVFHGELLFLYVGLSIMCQPLPMDASGKPSPKVWIELGKFLSLMLLGRVAQWLKFRVPRLELRGEGLIPALCTSFWSESARRLGG
jgi:hypothetical protein